MKPSKRPKYKLDPKKFDTTSESASQKKEKADWSESELYKEMLRAKTRYGHR